MKQTGQQFAPRQVAGGAHQHDQLRMTRANTRQNLGHGKTFEKPNGMLAELG